MKHALFAGAALLLTVSSAAFAASTPPAAGTTPGTPAGNPSTIPASTTTVTTPNTQAAAPATSGMSPGSPTEAAAATTGRAIGVAPMAPDTSAAATPASVPAAAGMGPGSPAEAAAAATGSATGVAPATRDTSAAATPPPDEQQELTSNLRQAGFTDVSVTPGSYIVQAKDKAGDPVTLFLSPDLVTVVSATDATDATMAAPSAAPSAAPAARPAPAIAGQKLPDEIFTSIRPKDDLSSAVIGLSIYNASNQSIGQIKDIAFGHHGVKAYIVGVGGFLGMGDHYVAVRPSAITLTYDDGAKKWHAAMDTTADQLKAAPEYKYPSAT